jgi:hypothetical protein
MWSIRQMISSFATKTAANAIVQKNLMVNFCVVLNNRFVSRSGRVPR